MCVCRGVGKPSVTCDPLLCPSLGSQKTSLASLGSPKPLFNHNPFIVQLKPRCLERYSEFSKITPQPESEPCLSYEVSRHSAHPTLVYFSLEREKQNIPHLASFLLLFCKSVKIHGEAKANDNIYAASCGFSISKQRKRLEQPPLGQCVKRETLLSRTLVSFFLPQQVCARFCFIPVFHKYFEYFPLKIDIAYLGIQTIVEPSKFLKKKLALQNLKK